MTSTTARAAAAAAVLIGAVLPAAACGEPSRIDAGALERRLPAAVVPDHPEEVRDVDCPRPIRREVGATTECSATVAGAPVRLSVTQIDDDASVEVEVTPALLDVDELADGLGARLSRDLGIPTTVVCDGPPVRVRVAGTEVGCAAIEREGRQRVLVVVLLDDDGSVDVRLR